MKFQQKFGLDGEIPIKCFEERFLGNLIEILKF